MTTLLSTLTANVATYVNRSDFTTQAELAINRAIQYYARRYRFWFNETTGTFNTVANQFAYGSADSVPTDIMKVDDATITIATSDIEPLEKRTMSWVLQNNISRTAGTPTDYAFYQNKFYLSLIPNAVYAITLYYLKSYSTLTSAQNNDFTDNAQDLLEARACWWIYSKLLRNTEAAATAKTEELEALDALMKVTKKLTASGKLVPTSF